jgi:hypothetical protein
MIKSRRMITVLAAALLILTGSGCGTSVATTTGATLATAVPHTGATADEYDVYSALIQSTYIDATQPKQIVIIASTAKPYPGGSVVLAAGAMKSSWPDLGDDILGDFKAKNQTTSALERTFTLSVPYALISEQELTAIFPTSATSWDRFFAQYPGAKGFLALSRVGFNQAKDTAVLYTEQSRGANIAEGDLVLMKKTDGRWTVQGQNMIWTS